MAPIEDLEARDLAWISDFVMNQMLIMLRPMMDHLQQTDATIEYSQRSVQRLSMDISEMRSDLERTNKYLAILRQGLGAQNEGRCVLQRGLENSQRTVKRLDEQMDNVLGAVRGLDDGIGQIRAEATAKHEELSMQCSTHVNAIQDLQTTIEIISKDTRSLKDDLLSNEARFEVWQRELRQVRRNDLAIVPKLEDKVTKKPPSSQGCRAMASHDTWPGRKSSGLNDGGSGPAWDALGTSGGAGGDGSAGGSQDPDRRRMSRMGSGSGRSFFQHVWPANAEAGLDADEMLPPSDAERLPLLSKQANMSNMSRPAADSAYVAAPRLRFSETMANPPSRGSPS
eukprot:gnl/TRDRNA2_/TRDRNA2_83411_c0_seq1.p1 gnl/TRDRNA2_/TRDRNA2_83411_c0~~gnl/TRDRNA2_/TRDRNA2_83411_c0_seq1.p1  ORF type:complete len:373 (-),score=57.89 gnl/TRDRNA2_/TRDRNA2_83411_c0_seq1:234-1253(-)